VAHLRDRAVRVALRAGRPTNSTTTGQGVVANRRQLRAARTIPPGGPTSPLMSTRKLPRQGDRLKEYSRVGSCLGRNSRGGTSPRLSWGRSLL
jgi:hypothetical protein